MLLPCLCVSHLLQRVPGLVLSTSVFLGFRTPHRQCCDLKSSVFLVPCLRVSFSGVFSILDQVLEKTRRPTLESETSVRVRPPTSRCSALPGIPSWMVLFGVPEVGECLSMLPCESLLWPIVHQTAPNAFLYAVLIEVFLSWQVFSQIRP